MPRRIAARIVTGPFAFLVAGTIDVAVLLARIAWAQARGRDLWD